MCFLDGSGFESRASPDQTRDANIRGTNAIIMTKFATLLANDKSFDITSQRILGKLRCGRGLR